MNNYFNFHVKNSLELMKRTNFYLRDTVINHDWVKMYFFLSSQLWAALKLTDMWKGHPLLCEA